MQIGLAMPSGCHVCTLEMMQASECFTMSRTQMHIFAGIPILLLPLYPHNMPRMAQQFNGHGAHSIYIYCLIGLHKLKCSTVEWCHTEIAVKRSYPSLKRQKPCRHSALPFRKSRPAAGGQAIGCKHRLQSTCQSVTADQRLAFFFFLGSSSISSAARLLSSLHTSKPTLTQALRRCTSLQRLLSALTGPVQASGLGGATKALSSHKRHPTRQLHAPAK